MLLNNSTPLVGPPIDDLRIHKGMRKRTSRMDPGTMLAALFFGAAFELLWGLIWSMFSARLLLFATIISGFSWWGFRVVVAGWRVRRTFLLWVVFFSVTNIVALLGTIENINRFGEWLTGSDDSDYISSGIIMRDYVLSTGNVVPNVDGLRVLRNDAHSGYGTLLGYLFCLLPLDEHSCIRGTMLVNMACGLMVMAVVIRVSGVLDSYATRFLVLGLACGFEVLYFTTEIRKDTLILLALSIAAWKMGVLIRGKGGITDALLIVGSISTLIALRVVYVGFVVMAGGFALMIHRSRGRLRSKLGVFALAILLTGAILWFLSADGYSRFRESESAIDLNAELYRQSNGGGPTIYRLPLVGQILYTILSPILPTPRSIPMAPWISGIARGIGNMGTMWALASVIYAMVLRRRRVGFDCLIFAVIGVMTVISAAYGSMEARHKLAEVPTVLLLYASTHFKPRCSALWSRCNRRVVVLQGSP